MKRKKVPRKATGGWTAVIVRKGPTRQIATEPRKATSASNERRCRIGARRLAAGMLLFLRHICLLKASVLRVGAKSPQLAWVLRVEHPWAANEEQVV
jgi:hypothetical protein